MLTRIFSPQQTSKFLDCQEKQSPALPCQPPEHTQSQLHQPGRSHQPPQGGIHRVSDTGVSLTSESSKCLQKKGFEV